VSSVCRALWLVVALVSFCGCGPIGSLRRGAGKLLSLPSAVPAWSSDSGEPVVQLYSPHTTAGLAGAYDKRYYIPEVRIWPDGRIIWVEWEGHAREVLEGHLTEEEREALLERIISVGFFEWEHNYYTLGGNSISPMYLLVNLADRSKEVREHGGAPDAYYELEEFLQSGAGAEGHDFLPTRGYVTLEKLNRGVGGAPWPSDTDLSPKEIGEGRYVEGEALRFVWEQVNQHPTAPVYVEHDGTSYIAMVQVPGVSYFQPPPVE